MTSASQSAVILEFGRFAVDPVRREILADGRIVELGGRAFDVLMVLIDANGGVLSKDELISRVWPGRVVEESNLQAQIAALRRSLGDDRDLVRTVVGQGYYLGAAIRRTQQRDRIDRALSSTNLPELVAELVGRDAEATTVSEMVMARRLVTLIGSGGIGKTRIALEVGRRLLPQFGDGVWVADLAPVADPNLVPVTVATALGLRFATGVVSAQRVAMTIGSRPMLVILDNCEHVIDAAARMADTLVEMTGNVCVIATSREPLRSPGEHLYWVPGLQVPGKGEAEAESFRQWGATRLFVERARAVESEFSWDKRNAEVIGAICRRLDGIPLAIELAAARISIGIDSMATLLDDRFRLLTGGYRTALARHQTMRATLDWSYDLLPQTERTFLRRLAIFAGAFELDFAEAVATGADTALSDVVEHIANLVTKSLISTEFSGAKIRYRLLETTRAYLIEKLAQSGELEATARRHAQSLRDVILRNQAQSDTAHAPDGVSTSSAQIDDVRAALDWALSTGGDAALGVSLTIAATTLWTRLSLMEESRGRLEQALIVVGSDQYSRMELLAALGPALLFTKGAVPEVGFAHSEALQIAERIGDTEHRLRALWGLWVDRVNCGAVLEAMDPAKKLLDIASTSPDPLVLPFGHRSMGFTLHYIGRQAEARHHLEHMLDGQRFPVPELQIMRFQSDPWVTARARLAVVLWLQGFPDQALRNAKISVDEALSMNHGVTLCNTLAQGACPVAYWSGDLVMTERLTNTLLDCAGQHAPDSQMFWRADGHCFKGMLLARQGDGARGFAMLRDTVQALSKNPLHARFDLFLGELARSLSDAGLVVEALATIDRAIARAHATGGQWYIAEYLRIKGEIVLCAGASRAAEVEGLFRESLDNAKRQGALSWELRCACSLARLWHGQGRSREATQILAPVYARFTEGFATTDLQAARALLEILDQSAPAPGKSN